MACCLAGKLVEWLVWWMAADWVELMAARRVELMVAVRERPLGLHWVGGKAAGTAPRTVEH